LEDKNVAERVQRIIETDTEELMGITFECICGKTHSIPIDYLLVEKGAIQKVPHELERIGLSGNGGLVFDRKIEKLVEESIRPALQATGISINPYPVGDGINLIKPEITNSKTLSERIDPHINFLISAGSGVVSDLTKNAASYLKLPFILIATAPSMNGYTSSMAALTDKGIKKTLMVSPARAVFADIGVLKESPIEMIRSGLGDIVSKSICNADWKLSQLVKKTYFCPVPFKLTDKTEPLYLEAAEEIGERSEHGISVLTDGIMRSGLSMTVIGTSTPSSGSEHLVSHYWDLMALIKEKDKYFHGVQVGVATIIILKLYDYIRNYPVREKIHLRSLKQRYPSRERVTALIGKHFQNYAEGIREEFFSKYMTWEEKEKEIEFVIENWNKLWDELDPYIRPYRAVEDALKKSGAFAYYSDLGKKREEVLNDIMSVHYIRGRYTILDLANDMNILGEAALTIL
jgi:glycerol-1-phosphate dehydrogenase [NAD(P)+]